jgi:hypothetical protein
MYLIFYLKGKREKEKTLPQNYDDVDVGLSCAEFISAHTCPKCGYYVDECNDYAYLFSISDIGRGYILL